LKDLQLKLGFQKLQSPSNPGLVLLTETPDIDSGWVRQGDDHRSKAIFLGSKPSPYYQIEFMPAQKVLNGKLTHGDD
jgi:hypothetical protein